ncbi:hypothetical protein [Paraherbaspirillum soli]|uniref:Uncharacterized protein n=1 Tax=Paraherbaspirillum soli TaxID=631222 RepID=A0ABW0MCF4_9BURK
MPRQAQQQITARPQDATPQRQREVTQIVARPVDTTVHGSSSNSELDGLISGLASFNPHLQTYVKQENEFNAKEAALTGESQALTASLDPVNASRVPESMPEGVNPAFREHFDSSYRKITGQRLGIEATAAISAEYDKQKMTDGFNVDGFLSEQLQQHTAGISDPTVRDEVAKQAIQMSRGIREQDNKIKLGQLKDSTLQSVNAVMGNGIEQAGNDPHKLFEFYQGLSSDNKAWQQYLTRPELVQQLVTKVAAQSINDKGSPALFDALDKIKDPKTGMTIADTNAELGVHIAQARKHAEAEQEKRIERDSQPFLTKQRVDWDVSVEAGNLIPVEVLANSIGVGKQFSSHEAAAAFDRQQREKVAGMMDRAEALRRWDNGEGWALAPDLQKWVSEQKTDGIVKSIAGAMNDPAQLANLKDAANQLARIHATGQATIPNEGLKRLINGLSAVPPDASGKPSQRFLVAAALYKSFPDNIRNLYFDEDTAGLMDGFVAETDSGVTPESAYQTAYRSISPEAKAQEKERSSNPEWRAKTNKLITKAVDEMHWQVTKDFIPGRDNLPVNLGVVTHGGTLEAQRFMRTHPNASEDVLKAHLEKWTTTNFVHDTEANLLIGIPPGAGGQATDKMIAWQQAELIKQYGKDKQPTLVHMGNGQYDIRSEKYLEVLGKTTFDQLNNSFRSATTITDDDRRALAELNGKAKGGNLSTDDINRMAPLMTKLRTIGQDNLIPTKAINDVQDKAFRAAVANIPKLTLGAASSVLAPTPQSANDAQAQKSSTFRFMQNVSGRTGTLDLTAALTTQGEGVVLKASPDPAGGAGNNIGMGYNLKANAGTIKEDFRKAGIPPEATDEIIAGRKSITQEQAERLLIATLPRYVDKAKTTVEAKYPGMWNRLTPQQQAVITDVAYQVRDFNKFGPSIDAVFSGDQERINKAFKVVYTDRNGIQKEDTRRNNLRANMLAGTAKFNAVTMNN